MYRVLVVDDEPASLKHICNVIQKYSDWAIVDTARNGMLAWEKIQEYQPDVIFSDVMMPMMNGIELVTNVKKSYPSIISVIVSGYNDFEYAKGAIQAGVCEYILKPVRPSEIAELMKHIYVMLEKRYYERRKKFLKNIVYENSMMDRKEMELLFPCERYYAAVYRKNGLPTRFSKNNRVDMFSMPQEKIIVYGRDDKEALYLCPEELLNGETFHGCFDHFIEKLKEKEAFYTIVMKNDSFKPEEFPEVLNQLYRKLDESIVIGRNQKSSLLSENPEKTYSMNNSSFKMLEQYVRKQEIEKIQKEWMNLIKMWEEEKCTQIWVEEKIRYLLFSLVDKGFIPSFNEFVLDDIFANVLTMEELGKNILTIICPEQEMLFDKDRKKEEYDGIVKYIDEHLSENLTAQSICKQFALSHTILSKLFHKYGNTSFSRYLTSRRMEMAMKIMNENPHVLVRDVAECVGYSDQFYFSRVFRSVYEISPSEFMEQK